MTVQEANRDALGRCKMRGCNLCDGYRKELEQYRALGTVEELKEAREKQVAKKPIDNDGYYCPICNERVDDDGRGYEQPYCMECGQKIDWQPYKKEGAE